MGIVFLRMYDKMVLAMFLNIEGYVDEEKRITCWR